MKPVEYYQAHLDAVSRSFALCIPQLSPPFRDQVALSYLLFRVLDTVEDAQFSDRKVQALQFESFRRFLREKPARGQIDRFREAFPPSLSDGERALLADTEILIADAHDLPAPARTIILDGLDRMAQGMALYAMRPPPLRLVDLEDVDRYCCVVAGIVGELLTRLWALGGGDPPSLLSAYRFGLFLQKVNILKDQAEDEAGGRFLVPDRRELLASLRSDAEGALSYLFALPRSERGYRTFCAWSLMLGAASLQAMEDDGGVRESRRAQTLALFGRTAEMIEDDAVRQQFAEILPRLPESPAKAAREKPEDEARVLRRVLGLGPQELHALGAMAAGQ
jgi:phytoene/squalene synthetase